MAKKKASSKKTASATQARSAGASRARKKSSAKPPKAKRAKPVARAAKRATTQKTTKKSPQKTTKKSPQKKPAARPRGTPPKPRTWDEPVSQDLIEEIASQAARGEALLFGADPGPRKPKAVVEAILRHVDDVNTRQKHGGSDLPLMLACAWGERVREALGYAWAKVCWDGGSSIALVPPDRSFAVYPFPYMKRMLAGPDVDNTVLLFFNMLAAGNVPDAPPRSYVSLS